MHLVYIFAFYWVCLWGGHVVVRFGETFSNSIGQIYWTTSDRIRWDFMVVCYDHVLADQSSTCYWLGVFSFLPIHLLDELWCHIFISARICLGSIYRGGQMTNFFSDEWILWPFWLLNTNPTSSLTSDEILTWFPELFQNGRQNWWKSSFLWVGHHKIM